ncbi:hypothetical protein MPER_03321 [Moniliophthora perniciosa FA553]|nr:hypothetical protein MPER_03321 [Moniliophthora perniciosa FA553]
MDTQKQRHTRGFTSTRNVGSLTTSEKFTHCRVAIQTYRDNINDTGKDVAVQAGPNGPENNHDLSYAYSPNAGFTWHNNWGQKIADMKSDTPVLPVSAGIVVFGIPKYGGILNQEAQTIDEKGRVHVLNRENTTGTEQWSASSGRSARRKQSSSFTL